MRHLLMTSYVLLAFSVPALMNGAESSMHEKECVGAPHYTSHSSNKGGDSLRQGIHVTAPQFLTSGNSFIEFAEIAFLEEEEMDSKRGPLAFSIEAEKLIEEKSGKSSH